MDNPQSVSLEDRVGRLELQLAQACDRIYSLEGRPILTPPPIAFKTPPSAPKEAAPKAAPPQSNDDVEYRLGTVGLLRGGAVVVILGIIFLVGLAISRGWITPQVQFVGEQLLCFAFLAVGGWKLKEKADFGEILTGIGMAGLYASFAGGHLHKHLYEAEILVGLFIVLSLLNLVVGAIASSRSFVVLGMIGGFVGAALPMQKHELEVSLGLLVVVSSVAAGIIAFRRWQLIAIVFSCFAALSFLPAYFEHAHDIRLAIACYVLAGLGAIAYARSNEEGANDNHGAWLVTVFLVGAAAGFQKVAHHGYPAFDSLIPVAIAAGLAVLYRADKRASTALWLSSGLIAIGFVPASLDWPTACATYGVVALALGATTFWKQSSVMTGLSWVALALGIISLQIGFLDYHRAPTREIEAGLELLLLTATALILYGTSRISKERVILTGGGVLLVGGLAMRLCFIGLRYHPISLAEAASLSIPLSLYSILLIAAGFRFKAPQLRYWGLATFAATLGKVVLIDLQELDSFVRVGLLLVLGLAMIGAGYLYIRLQPRSE